MQTSQRSFLNYLTQSLFILFVLLLSVLLIWVYLSTSKAIEKQQTLSMELNNRNSSKAMDYNLRVLFDSLDHTAIILSHSPIVDLDQKTEMLSELIQANVSTILDLVRFISVDQRQIAQADSPFYELSNANIQNIEQSEYYLDDGHLLSVQTPKETLWVLVVGRQVTHQASGKMLGTLLGGLVINNNAPLARELALLSDANYTALQVGNRVICSNKPLPNALRITAENMHGSKIKTSIQVNDQKQKFVISRYTYPLGSKSSLQILHFYKDTLQAHTKRTFLLSGLSIFLVTIFLFVLFFLISRRQIVKAIHQLFHYTERAPDPEKESAYTPGTFLEFNRVGEAIEKMVAELDNSRNELSTERALLVSLIDSIPDLIFYKDSQSAYLGCNTAFEAIIGQTKEQLVGQTDLTLWGKKTAEFFHEQDQKILSSGKTGRSEEWAVYPDGRRAMVDTIKTPYWGPDGSILGLIGISRDITDRKQTEKQILRLNHLREELLGLRSFDKKLTHITEAVIDTFDADFCRIWIIKPGDRCDSGCPHAKVTEGLHVCKHRERCLHLTASSGRYSGLDSSMHGRVPFGCYKIGMIASGDIASFYTNDVTHDSRVHNHDWAQKLGLVSFTGYRLFSDKGAPIGVIALFSKHVIDPQEVGLLEGVANTTSQIIQTTMAAKEKESMQIELLQAQKMEVIGLMASGVAHDLNNILAGIVGYPELLLSQLPQSSKLREPIEAIQESGERATVIVDDLLTVARGAASTREPHDINILIQEYLDSPEYTKLESLYPGVSCTEQLDAKNPTISCSPIHIKKTVMNLLTNAMEALGDTGNVTVSTYNQMVEKTDILETELEPGAYVLFTVQDHNGRIFVESGKKGTIFRLYFPVSTTETIVPSDIDTREELTAAHEHILVVDDEPHLRDLAGQMLRKIGYQVDSVCSGELAIEFVKDNPVDLIVMDMLMEPGINGRQTYEEILKLYPDQRAIIASGFSESNDIKAALELGASGFIKKPYSMAKLGQAVKEALNS